MIAGIEAFRRRRSAFVPLSPSVPQTQGTRGTNRDGLSPVSPMSPQENVLPVSATAKTAYQASPVDDVPMTDEATEFWSNFLERVDKCDDLINELCDLRGVDMPRRVEMLGWRKSTSPANLDTDIEYLLAEIATLTRTPAPTTGRCLDCLSFALAGLGHRCSHPGRSLPTEPPRADCLEDNECEKFIFWRPQSKDSTL